MLATQQVHPKRRRIGLVVLAAAIIAALWFGLPILRSRQPEQSMPDAEPQRGELNRGVSDSAQKTAAPLVATTSRLGVPVRLIKRPSLRPAPPYAAAYAKLLPAAQAGDANAQYILGLLLYECRDVPADASAMERVIDSVHQTHSRDGWDVGDPGEEERMLRSRFAECAGVPSEARGQYRDWLKRAADAGLIEAELDLPLRLPPGKWCQFLSECSPQQRAEQEALQKEAMDYVGRARDAGSAQALWTFGAWYEQGEVVPEDDVEAYANFLALEEINTAAGQPRRFDIMLESLRARLRAVDLDRAEQRARELLSNPNCCVLTP